MEKITKQRLVRTNAVYGGHPRIANPLDYAVDRANDEKNFYRKLSYIVRSMTSDHSFVDGNKRTALTVVMTEFQQEGIKVNKYMLTKTIVNLSKTGEGDILKIERKLRRCTRK